MARVVNFRKLKILLFSEAPERRKLLSLHSSLPFGDQLSSALLRKFWTVVLEMPAALRAWNWPCCVLGGDGGKYSQLGEWADARRCSAYS